MKSAKWLGIHKDLVLDVHHPKFNNYLGLRINRLRNLPLFLHMYVLTHCAYKNVFLSIPVNQTGAWIFVDKT